MRPATRFALIFAAVLMGGRVADADLANCFVMSMCGVENQLTEEQRQTIGERIIKAHAQSNASADDMMFMIWIGRTEPTQLYAIGRAKTEFGDWPLRGYRVIAPTYEGLLLGVKEIEQAFAANRIDDLKPAVRERRRSSPLYR